MSDAFEQEVQGEFAPADALAAQPALPNGFVKLGLAPELIAAVEDLGFNQPTAVQLQTIPLAMGSDSADAPQQQGGASSRYVDLMVSSQTGSG